MTITGSVFALAFLSAIVLAFAKNPIYGLYAYVADFYLHPPSRWWGQSLPDLRWSMLAAVATIVAIWIRLPPESSRAKWYQTPAAAIMIAFVAWFWIGTIWAMDQSLHLFMAGLVAKYVLVFYIVYRLVDTPERMATFLLLHVLGCLYLGYLALGSFSGGRLDGVGGPGIDDSNTLGMHLATGVMAGSMLLLVSRPLMKALCVVAVALAMNAIVMTGSRGAFLGLIAGGLGLVMFRPPMFRRKFLIYATLATVLMGVVASKTFWDRMSTLKDVAPNSQDQLDNSAQSRIAMFQAQLLMAKANPFGTGHRGSEILSTRYLDSRYLSATGARSSHNVFMTVLVEQGIPGAILLVAMCGWAASALLKLRRAAKAPELALVSVEVAAIAGSLIVVAVSGLFADFSKCEVQIWLLAMLASLSVVRFGKQLTPSQAASKAEIGRSVDVQLAMTRSNNAANSAARASRE